MCSCGWSNGGPIGGLTTALTTKSSVAKSKTVSVTSVLLPFPFPAQSKIITFISVFNNYIQQKVVSKVVFARRQRDCKRLQGGLSQKSSLIDEKRLQEIASSLSQKSSLLEEKKRLLEIARSLPGNVYCRSGVGWQQLRGGSHSALGRGRSGPIHSVNIPDAFVKCEKFI